MVRQPVASIGLLDTFNGGDVKSPHQILITVILVHDQDSLLIVAS